MREAAPLPLDIIEQRTDPRRKDSYNSLIECYAIIRMLVSRVRHLERRIQEIAETTHRKTGES